MGCAHKLALAVLLLAAFMLSGTEGRGGSSVAVLRSLQARRMSQTAALSSMERLKLFKLLVKLAEDLYHETESLETAVGQLRVAFLLCPSCRADEFTGKKFSEAFSIDGLEDRVFLTEDIFKAILTQRQGGPANLKLLWAGCHPYTLRYEYILKGVDVFSMDPNPAVAAYGSSHRHAVDILQNVGKYTPPGTFDMVIANGVIGWGIDSEEQVASFVKAMHSVLKPGGFLIVGYNRNMGQCCPFAPQFEPATFGTLPQRKAFGGHWQHTFEIFRRV